MKMATWTSLPKAVLATVALLLVAVVAAPPSFAAPSLTVSATSGLTDGQTLTVSGGGFEPGMQQIAVGQCVTGYTGPADCNLQGGATFKNADDSGSIGEFTIVVKEKFGSVDCTQVECVVAAAPLPNAVDEATMKANQVIIPISFGGAAAPVEDPAAAPAVEEIPKTGPTDALPLILIGAGALLVVGGGLRFATRRRPGTVA